MTNTTRELHYIDSPAGLIAIVERKGGVDTYHYVYSDHLGSILTLTSEAGTSRPIGPPKRQNFDA